MAQPARKPSWGNIEALDAFTACAVFKKRHEPGSGTAQSASQK